MENKTQAEPKLTPLEQIICNISTAEAEEHCNEPGFYQPKPALGKRPTYLDHPSTFIQDKSLVEQMRQKLQEHIKEWKNYPGGSFNSGNLILCEFNELFPEVQKVSFSDEDETESGWRLAKQQLPIQDIDALAEKRFPSFNINDFHEPHNKATQSLLVTANMKVDQRRSDYLEGYKQCLEDRGFSDKDMIQAVRDGWDMREKSSRGFSTSSWLADYKKSKALDKED